MPFKIVLIGLMLLSLSNFTYSEVIQIPLGQQGTDNITKTPILGQSKTDITVQFGEPTSRVTAIGEPPISQWEYEEFTVYFEKDKVIHSVKKFIATNTP